jgi:hypothetical protein
VPSRASRANALVRRNNLRNEKKSGKEGENDDIDCPTRRLWTLLFFCKKKKKKTTSLVCYLLCLDMKKNRSERKTNEAKQNILREIFWT